MFITLVTIFCLGEVCNHRGNDFNKVTINKSEIVEIKDHEYYWQEDGKFTDMGTFIPNKNATKMRGCYIKIKNKQAPYFVEFPCDQYVLPKLRSSCE